MTLIRVVALGSLCWLSGLVACGDDDAAPPDAAPPVDAAPPDAAPPDAMLPAPALWNPVDLPDRELAEQALALLGSPAAGGTMNCNECHALTRQHLRHWRALNDTTLAECLTDLSISTPDSARDMIDCLRVTPTEQTSPFQSPKVGVFAAAAHLDWFAYAFRTAYGDDWEVELDEFRSRVGMPKGGIEPFTQDELDIVAEWFVRGVPYLDDILPTDPRPTECTPGISADVGTYVADRALSGWRAVNAENDILMFGCAEAATVFDCLSDYPRAGDVEFGAGWESLPGATLRVLRSNDYASAFWTRSSADGRYVANGSWDRDFTSAIVDLVEDRIIPTRAFYDPGFFPDNSGFVFQGFNAYLCAQSVLDGSPTQINYNEPECSGTNSIGLYEHVGAAVGGGDYWSVDGQFVSDSGGAEPRLSDPDASFDSSSRARLTPMIHDGTHYVPGDTVRVNIPYEGDVVMSPSAGLLVTRVAGPGDDQLGFVMRRVDATPEPDGYSVEIPEIARYCVSGGKPALSFDERWMTFHHYVEDEDADAIDLGFESRSDPGFAPYKTSGAANIYLMDIVTGQITRVTRMNPGQYALYPHFRSDGWLYFIVRTVGSGTEHIIASDAALLLEGS